MTDKPLTWAKVINLEPALKRLLEEIRRVKDDKRRRSFCANNVWYGYGGYRGFKEPMHSLVGWEARNAELRTMEAYDLVYEKLYSALPDCRNCSCF